MVKVRAAWGAGVSNLKDGRPCLTLWVSPITRGDLSKGADVRLNKWGQSCESHWPQLTRRAHQQNSQKFLDPASDRSRHAPLQLGVSVPGHSCPDPSASVTSDKPLCTSGCSQWCLVLCFLERTVLPRECLPPLGFWDPISGG